jgi:F420-non-reducing hydrogenase iron-sulfur subunit
MRKAVTAFHKYSSGGEKMTTTLVKESTNKLFPVARRTGTSITVFHCFNALTDTTFLEDGDCEIKRVMTREVFLLRAFEAGADAVIVLVCPEGSCDYIQGNIRARKRVERVKGLLDEIGIGGERLNIYNIPRQDLSAVEKIINDTKAKLAEQKEQILAVSH